MINHNASTEAIADVTTSKWRGKIEQNFSTQFHGKEFANNFRNYEHERHRENENFATKLKVRFIEIIFSYRIFTDLRLLGFRI